MKYASVVLMLFTAAAAGYVIHQLVPEQPTSMLLSLVVGAVIGVIWPNWD